MALLSQPQAARDVADAAARSLRFGTGIGGGARQKYQLLIGQAATITAGRLFKAAPNTP